MLTYSKKLVLLFLVCCGFMYLYSFERESVPMLPKIKTHADIRQLFPSSAHEIEQRTAHALEQARTSIQNIVAVAASERTYHNTIQALDTLGADLGVITSAVYALQYMSPDDALRAQAQKALIEVQDFSVDMISNNQELFRAVKDYAQTNADRELLHAEEKKYLKETLDGFEKAGLGLPQAEQDILKQIKKDLAKLSLDFSTNINNDASSITVTRAELEGVSDLFIKYLKQDEHGNFIVGVDYPTYFSVMENCSIAATREKLWLAFNNRAYPANEALLKKIISLRDQRAKMVGFASYAHLELDDEMAKTPARVHEFLEDLLVKTEAKMAQELTHLAHHLPAGVALTAQGQFKPWDFAYVKAEYKRNFLSFDEEKLKEYFAMQHTVDQLLAIYEQFLGIEFRQEALEGLWHEDVRYVAAYTKDNQLLGHLLLDLHPRPNKYGHACMMDIVPAVREKNGEYHPPVIIVLANFSKPNADQPSLLRHDDVKTFFHEFGHAMHGLFGATQMAGFSGTNVTRDFVEVPSQMLEEWMYDAGILKQISKHYVTGATLDDATIKQIQEIRQFGSGYFVQRQVSLSLLALAYYGEGADKDPVALKQALLRRLQGNYFITDDREHFECSFGHLMGYGARYYSYLWSKVFALDMFAHVKKYGLLNYAIGKQYIDKVIGKGGSVEPEVLLEDFLGRKPTMDAFLGDLGL
jgi:thimet oligopeptidase